MLANTLPLRALANVFLKSNFLSNNDNDDNNDDDDNDNNNNDDDNDN